MTREQKAVVDVVAEMVANVMTVAVSVGDEVAAGDTLILLESMKMEIPVLAEHDGAVLAVRVSPGDVVQEGDVLVTLTRA
jgi:biotin carboxyl carrier protein